jgi:hypothetical protein
MFPGVNTSPPEGTRPMAKQTIIPNISVDGADLRGSWLKRRLSSDAANTAADIAAAKYENDVADLIDQQINSTLTGKAVLQAIKNCSGKTVTIVPATPEGNFACQAKPTEPRDAVPKGAHKFLARDVDPDTGQDEGYRMSDKVGTGKGSDALLRFAPDHPDLFIPAGKSDESLVHELVHTLRFMEGHETGFPNYWGEAKMYGDVEEFLAILVTNIYSSERYGNSRPLRRGHGQGALKLPAEQSTSEGFLQEWSLRATVKTLADQEGKLFEGLAANRQAPFNPIAEYWNNRTTKYK